METNNPLLTTFQVADLLALHPDTLRAWRSQGRGPAWVRLGSRYRYTSEAINAFIAAVTEGRKR